MKVLKNEELMPSKEFYRGGKMTITYHNDLNSSNLGLMSENEQAVFFAICGMIRDFDEETLVISFDEIENLLVEKKLGSKKITELLLGVNKKLLSLTCAFSGNREEDFLQMNIFSTFITKGSERTLKVRMNSDFVYILNNLDKNFTSFELVTMLSLKGKYVKHFHRLLKQYESTGYVRIKLEKLYKMMEVPESYKDFREFKKRALVPTINQLSTHFPNLRYETIAAGKGNKVTDLVLKFTPIVNNDALVEERMKRELLDRY